jgi:nucleotide-binding universal stress UspA family protein
MKEISYLRFLVPTAGPIPARDRADEIIHMAQKLNAELFILHIITKENSGNVIKKQEGFKALEIFKHAAESKNIKITEILHEGEIVESMSKFAEEHKIDLIIMGAGADNIVAEWVISDLKEQTLVPVVVLPVGFSEIIIDQFEAETE